MQLPYFDKWPVFLRFGFKLQTRLQHYQDIETAAALSELVYLSLLGFREAQRQIEHGGKNGLNFSLCGNKWQMVEICRVFIYKPYYSTNGEMISFSLYANLSDTAILKWLNAFEM